MGCGLSDSIPSRDGSMASKRFCLYCKPYDFAFLTCMVIADTGRMRVDAFLALLANNHGTPRDEFPQEVWFYYPAILDLDGVVEPQTSLRRQLANFSRKEIPRSPWRQRVGRESRTRLDAPGGSKDSIKSVTKTHLSDVDSSAATHPGLA